MKINSNKQKAKGTNKINKSISKTHTKNISTNIRQKIFMKEKYTKYTLIRDMQVFYETFLLMTKDSN